MLNLIKSIYWEIKSYFVPEKMEYDITGECLKCGKCCRYMYSFDTYTEKEFKIMQFLYPAYKRFYIKGKDDLGNFIFACKFVSDEGLCTCYDKRLAMCKRYPVPKINYPADLHEGCGFTVHKKYFKDYLEEK